MTRIAITGATGFIGKRLVAYLNGTNQIACLVRKGGAERLNGNAGLDVYEFDGTVASIDFLNEKFKPEIWIHLATNYVADEDDGDIDHLLESNIELSVKLFRSISKLPSIKLLNIGTAWQHYEEQEYVGTNLYAATKSATEAMLNYFVDRYDIKAITLYLYDTYDTQDERGKLVHLLLSLKTTSQELALSEGNQELNLLHIEEVLSGIEVALRRLEINSETKKHERFYLRSAEFISLRNLVGLIEDIKRIKLPVRFGAKPYRDREVMVPWKKGETLPSWQEKRTLQEHLRELISCQL